MVSEARLTFKDHYKSAFPVCAQYLANDDDFHVDMVFIVVGLLMQVRRYLYDNTIPEA